MPAEESFELEPGTPLARAVARAREAFARGDVAGGDAAYRQAVELAAGDAKLRTALAVDHAAQLWESEAATVALRRCDEYLDRAGPNHLALRLLRAEIRGSVGNHSGAGADAAAIRAALGDELWSLTADEHARLLRVEGLSAADRGDLDGTARLLGEARQAFLAAGNQNGVAIVDDDRRMTAVRQGEEPAVSEALSGVPPRTVADHLQLAMALKRQLRYEEALQVVLRVAAKDGLDPTLRLHALYEHVVLLRLTRQNEAAERLFPLLETAVAASPDPVAKESVARLCTDDVLSAPVSPRFDRRVQHARRLVADTRLDEAESLLADLHSRARTDRDISTWHLAAGELELARHEESGEPSFLRKAAGHLGTAADRAAPAALAEVRVLALRLLGRACARLGTDERAAEYWAEAHRIEERIAKRQITDAVRVGMLEAAPDEHDERIRAAAKALDKRGPEAAAAVVVAMEAARGATILDRILPENAGLARDLPRPSDLAGAWRWVDGITRDLPRSQVVWIMHATPDRVYHAVIGRGLLHHASAPLDIRKLTHTIDTLKGYWTPTLLDHSIASSDFDQRLGEIADQVRVDAILRVLPRHVHRIAIVAGRELSDVPFAALVMPGTRQRIGHRFALSDLPCLSARRSLHHRSLRQRGDHTLLVRPPADDLTPPADMPGRPELNRERATLARLRAALESHRHRLVRIHSHGKHVEGDPVRQSYLQLAPEGRGQDGRLRPEELERMDLTGCGTLVLGACESGMAQRRGRDEPIGFVRAAVHAGAASAVAARWIAESHVAVAVADRFERYVRYLPRDMALQRAQLDVCDGMPGIPADLSAPDHPARWACWTLYGDSGYQTGAGPVRRLLRSIDERRQGATHR